MTDNISNTASTASKAPTHIAYQVRDAKAGKSFWTRIGAAWSHADGNGFGIPPILRPTAPPVNGSMTQCDSFAVDERSRSPSRPDQSPSSVFSFTYATECGNIKGLFNQTKNEDSVPTSLHPFDPTGLSEAERLLLAGELLDMAYAHPSPLTAVQVAEMERRDAEADAGLVQGEPWERVRERLKPQA